MSENKTMTKNPSASSATEPDAGMDLAAIMAGQQQKAKEAEEAEKKAEEKKKNAETTEKKKTPLEELRDKQKSGLGKGIVYDDDVLQKEAPVKQLRNSVETTERLEAFEESIKESDERLEKRRAVVLIKRPTEPTEYIQLETELDCLQFDKEGKPYFDMSTKDITGQTVTSDPEWFIIRTEEYGPYNEDTEKLYSIGKTPDEVKDIIARKEKENTTVEQALDETETDIANKGRSNISTSADDSDDGDEDDEYASADRKKLVQILIDKTGYGISNIEFTEDEKKKIAESDQILVTSVKKLDIASIKVKPSNADKQPARSFLQVAREHQIVDSHADVAFAVSGFRGQMRGLSYGELADISTDPEGSNFDQNNKKCTVVYNAMISTNRPEPFKDYEDFLKNFSYYDLDMAIYGLYVATFPDTQYIDLTCGRESCKKTFQTAYNTRSLLRIDTAYQEWLDIYSKVVMAKPYEVPDVYNEAPLQNPEYFELPQSKYIIEISPATLYDYLYNILPILSPDEFEKTFGPADEITPEMRYAIDTIGVVRRVLVPDVNAEGEYIEFTNAKDLCDAIMSLSPDESRIVRDLAYAHLRKWTAVFGIADIDCPHCHAKTPLLPMTMENMVFRAHEQRLLTSIDVQSLLQI